MAGLSRRGRGRQANVAVDYSPRPLRLANAHAPWAGSSPTSSRESDVVGQARLGTGGVAVNAKGDFFLDFSDRDPPFGGRVCTPRQEPKSLFLNLSLT